jgi:hypothetical protein
MLRTVRKLSEKWRKTRNAYDFFSVGVSCSTGGEFSDRLFKRFEDSGLRTAIPTGVENRAHYGKITGIGNWGLFASEKPSIKKSAAERGWQPFSRMRNPA